ncbi:MAG: hypothetical protein U0792_05235 [Gemmataceae bacterium]
MSKAADYLAHALDGLFDGSAHFIVSDGSVGGPDGLVGLRLIANCLSEQFDEDGEQKDTSAANPNNASVKDVKKQLKKLAKKKGAWFVVCYQPDGSDEWCMAWSDSLRPSEAYEIMTHYVESGWLPDC